MPVACKYQAQLPVEETTFHDFVLQHIRDHGLNGDREALVDVTTNRSYTFTKLHKVVTTAASSLHNLKLHHQDVVVFALPNSPEYLILSLAVMSRGAIVSGINPIATAAEIHRQINSSGAVFVCVDRFTIDKCLEAIHLLDYQIKGLIFVDSCPLPDVSTPVPLHHLDDLMFQYPTPTPPVHINVHNDLCLLPYSSGTTGPPKGVMLTHYGEVAMLTAQKWNMLTRNTKEYASAGINWPEDTFLGHLPMFHIFGYMFPLMALTLGCRVAIMPKFEPENFLRAIQKYKVKIINFVPPIAQFLAKNPLCDNYDLSSMKCVMNGAAPLRPETEKELMKKYPNLTLVGQGYGMTETGLATHLPAFDPGYEGNAGVLCPNLLLKIVDPVTGRELGENEDGEVCVKGVHIMKGYLNNKKATEETFDADGYLHTGDIGHYVGDYIFIVDRIKELIKVNGMQVAPAELEAYLQVHPDIMDAAVIGVPDDRCGEVPKAFVVVKDGRKLSVDDIKDHIAAHVSPYKRLGYVEFVDEVPKSAAGKILRRQLRSRVVRSKL